MITAHKVFIACPIDAHDAFQHRVAGRVRRAGRHMTIQGRQFIKRHRHTEERVKPDCGVAIDDAINPVGVRGGYVDPVADPIQPPAQADDPYPGHQQNGETCKPPGKCATRQSSGPTDDLLPISSPRDRARSVKRVPACRIAGAASSGSLTRENSFSIDFAISA